MGPVFLVSATLFFVFLQTTSCYQCPDRGQIWPCNCMVVNLEFLQRHGLDIQCPHIQIHQVKEVLQNLTETNQPVYLQLFNISLMNLPSDLLTELDLKELLIHRCNVSSVDENAFEAVAENLTELSFSRNNLSTVPSGALRNLTNLETLNLSYNRLEVLPAEAFKGLSSLRTLIVSKNRIKFVDEAAFEGIGSQFQSLYLSDNNLTSVPTKALLNVTSLRYVYLNRNQIVSLDPQETQASGQPLGHLSMSQNNIRQLPARAFLSPMNKIRILNLHSCSIECIDNFAFQGLEDSLVSLELSVNRLEQVPFASFKNLSKLEVLDLSNNNIQLLREMDLEGYGKSLKKIYLDNNQLAKIEPRTFVDLESLEYLILGGNRITTLPYEIYMPILHTLRSLEIHGNPLHCDCGMSWFRDWMKGDGSRIVRSQKHIDCSSPENFSNVALEDIPTDRLVCEINAT